MISTCEWGTGTEVCPQAIADTTVSFGTNLQINDMLKTAEFHDDVRATDFALPRRACS